MGLTVTLWSPRLMRFWQANKDEMRRCSSSRSVCASGRGSVLFSALESLGMSLPRRMTQDIYSDTNALARIENQTSPTSQKLFVHNRLFKCYRGLNQRMRYDSILGRRYKIF